MITSGSSPRVRGKHRLHVQVVRRVRIIPARAGQTWPAGSPAPTTSDHPRACGANHPFDVAHTLVSGSSPRVRGKQRRELRAIDDLRIIPARAGQTHRRDRQHTHPPDHPRACGANVTQDGVGDARCGSSPRVRGKPVAAACRALRKRIIPARAGQTKAVQAIHAPSPDHPRACGANVALRPDFPRIAGSSPRVRGKPQQRLHAFHRRRIIPARAGQTTATIPRHAPHPDHPRACGANSSLLFDATSCAGSSPRVRGKHGLDLVSAPLLRIIPARAGQTPDVVR